MSVRSSQMFLVNAERGYITESFYFTFYEQHTCITNVLELFEDREISFATMAFSQKIPS